MLVVLPLYSQISYKRAITAFLILLLQSLGLSQTEPCLGLIGHLSYDLMVLWRKQADDDCDSTLMSQGRVDADAVGCLQVLSTHTGLHHISSNVIELNETFFSRHPFLHLSHFHSHNTLYFFFIYIQGTTFVNTRLKAQLVEIMYTCLNKSIQGMSRLMCLSEFSF